MESDRFWWVGALLALVILGVAVAFPLSMLSTLPPADSYLLPGEITQDIVLALFTGAMALGGAIFLLVMSVRGRSRMRKRRVAIRGDLDAIPPSRLVPNPAKAPDVSSEPLVLSWRAAKQTMFVTGPLALLMGFVLLAELVGMPLLIVFGIFSGNARPVARDTPSPLMMAGLVLPLALGIAVAIVMGRYIPSLFGRPFGITATSDGIEQRTLSGGRRSLRWEEMRLLEVASIGQRSLVSSNRAYVVYGTRGRVTWDDPPGGRGEFTLDGISVGEMTLRQRAVLDLINARTGLAPRTFSKVLQATGATGPERTAPKRSEGVWIGALGLLLLAACTFGAGMAAIVLPVSAVVILNRVIAGSLAILALAIILGVARILVEHTMRREQGALLQAPVAAPPSLDAPEAVHVLSYSMPAWTRLLFAILGVLLMPNLVPVLVYLFGGPFAGITGIAHLGAPVYSASTGNIPSPPSPLAVPLDFVLGFYGLIGLVMVRGALAERGGFLYHADRRGLGMRLGKRDVAFLPWDEIERVVGRTRGGRVVSYVVTGDAGRRQITWQTQPSGFQRPVPEPGALAITPDEMAALVARQSGKTLEMESAS